MLHNLHPEQVGMLDKLPDDKHVFLLTRHSIRELSETDAVSYKLPLTPEGVELARCWGKTLKRPLHCVYSSPVARCVDTASHMLDGAEHGADIKMDMILTEPGCFVQDIIKAGPVFLAEGPLGFLNKHINEAIEGTISAAEGTARLFRLMIDNIGPSGQLSLFVTHDTVLATVVYYLFGEKCLTQAHWPWMMEGAFIWFDENKVHWLWRGKYATKMLPVYEHQDNN
ncbi:MAG: histidine phosphatase family protein [Pseudomonadales bacterium]|nr:histidine phosphatase family protein [Pseudomonadales bacterium]